MKVKKEDKILVIAGKYRGKSGKVLACRPLDGKIKVEGINIVKKHAKPRKQGEKGQIVEMPSFFDVSNVKVICTKCGKATRVGIEVSKTKTGKRQKSRICKKCGQVI